MNPSDAWIGLAEVAPEPGNNLLGDATGAFVNVVALASNENQFYSLLYSAMAEHGFRVIGTKDVQPFSSWKNKHQPRKEIVELVEGLTPASPIQFDEFQSYLQE